MKNTKYILVLSALIGFTSCNEIEDVNRDEAADVLPELTSGSADFTTYVSLGGIFYGRIYRWRAFYGGAK
ncbi:hypothetical protein JCM19274_3984 [Algibacter lectus]|uniref:Uncharacterized protein n=1 Tax=Algibacter lectus TaxID=221126 RepID=A0A090WVR2_9FLAO|nr:hypothetical protein JCM19274_3984 [Algibacter lectus]